MTLTGKVISRDSQSFTSQHNREAETSNLVPSRSNKTVQMYLRIKPPVSTMAPDEDVYRILDSTTISTKFPSSETSRGNTRRARSSRAARGRRHAFTRIFGSETSQAEIFERSIKHRLADLLGGESSTIMAYGTRDSGKTYTLFGTPASPGIIPRSIELVYSAINCTLTPWYKPTWRGVALSLDETTQSLEARRRMRLLGGRSMDARRVSAEARRSLENSQPADTKVLEGREGCGDGGSMYAVWLSFAEIYNGNIYDLLDDSDDDAETQRPSVDNDGRIHGRNLRAVYATTALEALRILGAARPRLNTVATTSNPASSRSHAIFTMHLMRYRKERAADEVVVSTLSLCDLAGSSQFERDERGKARARENSDINSSLLVLGKCLKAMGRNRIVPFRESNLTRMFQRALNGQENLTLLVNVAFAPDLYAETRSTFGFCVLARKLLNEPREESRERPREFETRDIRSLQVCENDVIASSPVQATSESVETVDRIDSPACREMRERNERLMEVLEATRSDILNREYAVRQELGDHYSRVIDELEATYRRYAREIQTEERDLLKWSVRQIESFYKERIDSLTRRKRRKRADNGDYIEDNRALYEELEAENAQISSAAMTLKEALRKLKRENQTILCERNKCSFELALVTEELRKFREFARARIREWGADRGDIEDDCLVNNLERLMDERTGITKMKPEVTNEYARVTKSEEAEAVSEVAITKQRRLSRSGSLSDEASTARIRELEVELARKEAYIVTLVRHVQTRDKQLAEIQQLSNENARDRKWKYDGPTNVSFDDCTVASFFDGDTPVSPVEKNPSRVASFAGARQRELNDRIGGATLFATEARFVESSNKRRSNVLRDVNRTSFLSGSGSVDCDVSRSSDRSSRNDSGISGGSRDRRSVSIVETEDKYTQTYIVIEKHGRVAENVEQFETVRTDSTSENHKETSHLVELSRELEIIKAVICALNEATRANEREIARRGSQSPHEEEASEQLIEDDTGITIAYDGSSETVQDKMQRHKREIDELTRELMIKEENKDRIFKCLERYAARSKFFEDQLLWMRNQLDKCKEEHLTRIENLEKEVSRKNERINELDGRIVRMQRELAKDLELFKKVDDFEMIVNRWQKDKNELYKQLCECSETQLTLEDKLTELTTQIAERESRLASLRNEVRDITDINVASKEKTRRLSERVTKSSESISSTEKKRCRDDLCEDAESVVRTKIDNFRFRFPGYQYNYIGFLNKIWKAYDDSQDEITRLNLQLRGKEREIFLLKNDNEIVLQNYKILERHLRGMVNGRKENFKAIHLNGSDDSERSLTEKYVLLDSLKKFEKTNDKRRLDEERNLASDLCLIPKRVSSEALYISSVLSEDFTMSSDKTDSVVIKLDIKSYQTENGIGSTLRPPLCDADNFKMEIDSNVQSFDNKNEKNISEWTNIRRIHGRIALSHL